MCSVRKICIFLLFPMCIYFVSCKKSDTKPTTSQKDTIAHKTQNLIIITMDGYRWQEVFKGADSNLLYNGKYTSESKSALSSKFWASTTQERRKKLMPFFWNTIANSGALYGNRTLGCKVNVKNPYWISYPGYNEIFTGYPDPKINSNNYGENPNKNVLEFINNQIQFKGQVACFGLWDWFTGVLNKKRSGLYIVAGHGVFATKVSTGKPKEVMEHLNTLPLFSINDPKSEYDKQVYSVAKASLMQYHPKVTYIGFGNTDTYGHEKKYDCYLDDAHNIDAMVQDLWNYIQTSNFYKGKTTLFLCPDHGRGTGNEWTSHGAKYLHSDETWCAVMGPDTKAKGEIGKNMQIYQEQYAQSFAAFLGLKFTAQHPIAGRVKLFMDNN